MASRQMRGLDALLLLDPTPAITLHTGNENSQPALRAFPYTPTRRTSGRRMCLRLALPPIAVELRGARAAIMSPTALRLRLRRCTRHK